jgi:ATP-binding cassette subfamily F protein 3
LERLLCSGLSPDFPVGCTVRDALERPLSGLGTGPEIGEALKKFRFSADQDRPVATLSGGEKTRLQLAKIWLSGADFLLLDEPTNHLDTENLDWLESFVRDYSGTIIMVSHDRYFLDRTVSRVLELRKDGAYSYEGNYSDYHRAKQERLARDQKTFWTRKSRPESWIRPSGN